MSANVSAVVKFVICVAGAFATVAALASPHLVNAQAAGWPPLKGMLILWGLVALFCSVLGFGVTECVAKLYARPSAKRFEPMRYTGYAAGGGVTFGFVTWLFAAIGDSGARQGAGLREGAISTVCYFLISWVLMWVFRRAFSFRIRQP